MFNVVNGLLMVSLISLLVVRCPAFNAACYLRITMYELRLSFIFAESRRCGVAEPLFCRIVESLNRRIAKSVNSEQRTVNSI